MDSASHSRLRIVGWFLVGVLLVDCVVLRFQSTWERYSPDEYAIKVAKCAERPRDFVLIGGSPVAEGLNPDLVAGFRWEGRELNDGYAVGLSGATTADVYLATRHACPTAPRVLVYGITASDINDARREPHGPHSLMTWDDLPGRWNDRAQSREWTARHFILGRLSRCWSVFHYRHGIRTAAAAGIDEIVPGSCPFAVREARENARIADDLVTGRGYAPTDGFVTGRYDEAKASGQALSPFQFLDNYRTGKYLTDLHRMADWAAANGTAFILLDVPVTADLTARYPAAFGEYRKHLAEFQRTRGVTVLRASRTSVGLDDSDFADVIHLNAVGAGKLSRWLKLRLENGGHLLPTDVEDDDDEASEGTVAPPLPASGRSPRTITAVVFASKFFFIFLPIVLAVYHLLVHRGYKYLFLLLASWLFYAWMSPQYLWVILLLTAIDYIVGLRIERATTEIGRKQWLAASIISNLGLLFAFKYTTFVFDNLVSFTQLTADPAADSAWDILHALGIQRPFPMSDRTWDILLPLGISFHTFQGISYTVDVYRRQVKAVTYAVDYALFVAFFPQLAAGPIVRAIEFLPQMIQPPTVSARQVADGLALFAFGMVKKLVIADNLDQLFVTPAFAHPECCDAAMHRWALVAWAVQIYCDFSGYTDMARGAAKWFGFELPDNFRLPYLATSISDFWRRWHLSLSTWLRDYLYFPLGGSQRGATRTYFNLMALFVLCGLWHGAAWNWLAYGAFNGILMGLHRAYDRSVAGIPWVDAIRGSWWWKIIAWVATAFQFLVGLTLIRMESWAGGGLMIRSLAGGSYDPPTGSECGFAVGPWGVPVVVPILIVAGMAGHGFGLFRGLGMRLPSALPVPIRMAAGAVGIAAVVAFSPGVAKTFIYIQF